MKRPRAFGPRPHRRYRPATTACPWCGAALVYSHSVWAKWIPSLDRLEHVTNLGYRGPTPDCRGQHTVCRSAQAEAQQVRGSTYGLDVIAHLGALRFGQHQTRTELGRHLDQHTAVQISERHVQNLLEIYLALLRASQQDLGAILTPVVPAHGGLSVSLDGLQPEQGHAHRWGGARGTQWHDPRRQQRTAGHG